MLQKMPLPSIIKISLKITHKKLMKISKEPMSWNWKIYIETVVWLMDTNSSIPVFETKNVSSSNDTKRKATYLPFSFIAFYHTYLKKEQTLM